MGEHRGCDGRIRAMDGRRGGQRSRLSEQGASLMAAAMVSAAVRSCSVGLLYMSRTARPDTFGSETGGFQGSLYAGESGGPPAETRSRSRVRNRDQSVLAGEEIPSGVSRMSGSRKGART